MKDFIKWLGVNEKVAKIVVWMLIFMTCLIIINTFLDSIGISSYKLTYDNISKINSNKTIEILVSMLICLFNFLTIALIVFEFKSIKKMIKYIILYLMLNFLITIFLSPIIAQFYVLIYMIIFGYMFSNKKIKYIIYMIASIIINMIVQYICYQIKLNAIDFNKLNSITKNLLGLDYVIIMAIIILVKELVINKRGEKHVYKSTVVGKV